MDIFLIIAGIIFFTQAFLDLFYRRFYEELLAIPIAYFVWKNGMNPLLLLASLWLKIDPFEAMLYASLLSKIPIPAILFGFLLGLGLTGIAERIRREMRDDPIIQFLPQELREGLSDGGIPFLFLLFCIWIVSIV